MEPMMTELEWSVVELYQLGWLYDEISAHLHVRPETVDEIIEMWLEMCQRDSELVY